MRNSRVGAVRRRQHGCALRRARDAAARCLACDL